MRSFSLAALFCALAATVRADNPKALPVEVPAPAFVDSVTFKIQSEGEKRVLTVTTGPTLVRIDEPSDRLSVIYDPRTEYYIGLENSNYTYWDFTWPKVRDDVQASKRYETRLRDLGPELMGTESSPSATDTNTPPVSTTAGTDDSGYVWHTTTEKKEIADLECEHWIGQTLAGENINAWCANGRLPRVAAAVATLRAVNEPMALVPVRNFVPPLVFVAWDALTRGGVTPVLITWGADTDLNRFALVEQKEREGKLSFFEVPKMFMKTTLVTMDGILKQKPVTASRSEVRHPRQQTDQNALHPVDGLQ